jgi:chromosome segregation ATPase
MSEIKLTEIERRIIQEQRRYPQASYISPCGIIEIMDTYIRELEAKAGGDCENCKKCWISIDNEIGCRIRAQNERDALATEAEKLRRENERLSSEVNGLRDALEDAINRRAEAQEQRDKLTADVVNLRLGNTSLGNKLDRLRADLVAAQEQNLVLSNELRKAKDRAEAAHLAEQQMMEFAIEKIVASTIIKAAAAAIIDGAKGDA